MKVTRQTGGLYEFVDSGGATPLSKKDAKKMDEAYKKAREQQQKGEKNPWKCSSCKKPTDDYCHHCIKPLCKKHISLSHPNYLLKFDSGHACKVYYRRFFKKNVENFEVKDYKKQNNLKNNLEKIYNKIKKTITENIFTIALIIELIIFGIMATTYINLT